MIVREVVELAGAWSQRFECEHEDAGCHWEMEREAFLHPHIEFVVESLCEWACLRECVLIGGSKVARGRGYEIEDFLLYGFGGKVYVMSKRLCCGWSMALRE
ncbi:hypothetical protein TNCV_2383291 [Trichonephila clavipes]|nr:hypothetical protein TNCV_2383291 [Trichonephila clavipes]